MYPPHHYGGYELSCQDVVARWRARGHEVLVLTSTTHVEGETRPETEEEIRRVLGIYMRGHHLDSPSLRRRFGIERQNQRELIRAIDEFLPDVVSIWNHAALSLGMLNTIVQRQIPMVLVVCNEWLIRGEEWDAWMRLFRGRPRLARLVARTAGLHTTLPDLSSDVSICYLTEWIRAGARKRSPLAVEPSTVVYSGIELEDFPAAATPRSSWEWRLAYVGRLDWPKGVHVAIDSLAHLPDEATLEVVGRGDDEYASVLRARAADHGLEKRVVFTYAPRGELHRHYSRADALLFPVTWDEPFGLVPLEAMACGTPVVATGTGGSAEVLLDNVNCLLVPKDDAIALADATKRLAGDVELRRRLISAGRVTAQALSVDRLAETLETWHLAAAARFTDGPVPDCPSPAQRLVDAGIDSARRGLERRLPTSMSVRQDDRMVDARESRQARARGKAASALRRLAKALEGRTSDLGTTKALSDRLQLALEPPRPHISPRGDAVSFVEETRRALERFPGMATPPGDGGDGDLATRVKSVFWYHTIDLPGGITTDGIFDHRPLVPFYGLPDDLQGKRALDVGTWDGFWAFELERRGASVTAIDVEGLHGVDIPDAYRRALEEAGLKEYYGVGFEMARRALNSKVERRLTNVYDLGPETVGEFEFVHMGDLLLHLEFPTKALRGVRSVTAERAHVVTPFDPELEGDTIRYLGGWSNVVWWIPSLTAAGQMVMDAGFSSVDLHATYDLRTPIGSGGSWRAVFRATP